MMVPSPHTVDTFQGLPQARDLSEKYLNLSPVIDLLPPPPQIYEQTYGSTSRRLQSGPATN